MRRPTRIETRGLQLEGRASSARGAGIEGAMRLNATEISRNEVQPNGSASVSVLASIDDY